MFRKRWAEPGDLKRRCFRSRTPDGLMRILGTIIRTLIVDVLSRQAEGSNGDVIGVLHQGTVVDFLLELHNM